MNDNYIKFEFEIRVLHVYHEFIRDNIFTVSVYNIYFKFKYNRKHPNNILSVLQTSVPWTSNKKKILDYFTK